MTIVWFFSRAYINKPPPPKKCTGGFILIVYEDEECLYHIIEWKAIITAVKNPSTTPQ